MKFIKGDFKVEWQWIGEGRFEKEYDPHNPLDDPLLRFYCYKKIKGKWEEIWDTSQLTIIVKDTPHNVLEMFTESIFKALAEHEIFDVGGEEAELEASRQLHIALKKLSWVEV